MVHVGIVTLTLRLHGCRSLKEKRHTVRSLIDQLRHQFGASVAECEHQDEWQLAGIGIAMVSGDRRLLERLLEEILDYAEDHTEAEVVGVETEVL